MLFSIFSQKGAVKLKPNISRYNNLSISRIWGFAPSPRQRAFHSPFGNLRAKILSFLKHQVYELDSLLMLFLSDCKAIRIWEVKEPQVPSGVWGGAPSFFYENIFSSSSYFSCVISASCVVPTRCTTYVQRP